MRRGRGERVDKNGEDCDTSKFICCFYIFICFTPAHANITFISYTYEIECTYSHFEHSSECPTCRRKLGENDFTELVVADGSGKDIAKSKQNLFSKKSGSESLHYSDVCQSLIQQIECSKQSTKLLLKQLLVESHRAGGVLAGSKREATTEG